MKFYYSHPKSGKGGSVSIAGFIRNILTDEERDELDEWVVASDENMKLFAELTDAECILP